MEQVKPTADRRAQAERFFRGVYDGDSSVVDELASEKVVMSYPVFSRILGTPAIRGRQRVRDFVRRFEQRWTHRHCTIHQVVAEGNEVVLIWSFAARYVGPPMEGAPAPNQAQSWGGMTWYRFDDDGLIAAEIGEESAPGPIARVKE